MDELKKLLINVPNSYYDFVVAMMSFAEDSSCREEKLLSFIKENPYATASDVIKYASFELDLIDERYAENVTNAAS